MISERESVSARMIRCRRSTLQQQQHRLCLSECVVVVPAHLPEVMVLVAVVYSTVTASVTAVSPRKSGDGGVGGGGGGGVDGGNDQPLMVMMMIRLLQRTCTVSQSVSHWSRRTVRLVEECCRAAAAEGSEEEEEKEHRGKSRNKSRKSS